jgi:hypothetical protein
MALFSKLFLRADKSLGLTPALCRRLTNPGRELCPVHRGPIAMSGSLGGLWGQTGRDSAFLAMRHPPSCAKFRQVVRSSRYRELCPVHRGVIAMSGSLGGMWGQAGRAPFFPRDAPRTFFNFNCRIRSCRNCRFVSCWASVTISCASSISALSSSHSY